ncbi:MAG: hypothetical protein A2V70_06790 [Planctomycetes bacterium RBG_13_63_9]|nr:MAG: hypothetical protein A2V70_06790 [Planctomycetes bacterium RBG_13_63_9]
MGVFTSVLYALGRFPAKTVIETGIRLATAGLMLVVLFQGGGLVALAILILASTVLKGLCDAVAVRFYLPSLRFSPTLAGMETFRSIRGYSIRAFVLMIAGRISYSSDAIVIGAFLAPEYITYFVVAARLIEYVKTGTCSITNVLTPAISALEARGDYATIRRAFCDGTRYILWLIVPVVVGLLMLGKSFLTLWLGAPYADRSYPTLAILSIPLVFYLSQSIGGRILYGIGKLRWFARFAVAQAVANLSLSIALIGPLGIEGVAIGTAIPSLLMAAVMAAYACRTLQVTTSEYLRRAYLQPLGLAILPIAVWAAPLPSPSASWANLVITGAIGVLSYWAAAALLEFGTAPILRLLKLSRPTASR